MPGTSGVTVTVSEGVAPGLWVLPPTPGVTSGKSWAVTSLSGFLWFGNRRNRRTHSRAVRGRSSHLRDHGSHTPGPPGRLYVHLPRWLFTQFSR